MDEQTTPKKVRRVGSIAFALVLIAAGVLLIVYQFVPQFDLLKILKFSPVILIALGIEMLVYSYAALQGPYADAETFAADCMAVMQRAADDGLGFTCYHFNADEDTDDGISYYLDCVASYPAGLTAAQVAQRVQASYHYDYNSFSSEADRDDYIRRQLQNEISDEYADRHDGAYPDEKYLNEETERRFAERTGMATPESAQA